MYQNPWASRRIQLAVQMARPWLSPGTKVVEYGCYTQHLKQFLPADVQYQGIDQQSYGQPLTWVMDFDRELTQPLVKGQVIFCLETLEHLKFPTDFLFRLLGATEPGGRLIVSLPNEATLFHRLRGLTGVVDPMVFEIGKHLHLPSIWQTLTWLKKYAVVEHWMPYTDLSAAHSTHPWLGPMMRGIPEGVWNLGAAWWPSGLARGAVYRLRQK